MKYLFFVFFLTGMFLVSAQNQLNDYKYVIVPKKFDAFKKENQYQSSTLVKFLLTENGFNAVYEDALPEDLNANRCSGLVADLIDDSGMFSTKVSIVLRDCNTKEIFSTQQGMSKIKEFKPAYNDAIREAFKSFKGISYSYTPKTAKPLGEEPITVSFKNDVKKPKPPKTVEEDSEKKNAITAMKDAVPSQQGYENPVVVPDVSKEQSASKDEVVSVGGESPQKGMLYAQELPNGFQLVDSTPKIRMQIFKSSANDIYLAKSDDKNGILYNINGKWMFEYYEGDKLISEELDIKF